LYFCSVNLINITTELLIKVHTTFHKYLWKRQVGHLKEVLWIFNKIHSIHKRIHFKGSLHSTTSLSL